MPDTYTLADLLRDRQGVSEFDFDPRERNRQAMLSRVGVDVNAPFLERLRQGALHELPSLLGALAMVAPGRSVRGTGRANDSVWAARTERHLPLDADGMPVDPGVTGGYLSVRGVPPWPTRNHSTYMSEWPGVRHSSDPMPYHPARQDRPVPANTNNKQLGGAGPTAGAVGSYMAHDPDLAFWWGGP
jgi:hypothetical protein